MHRRLQVLFVLAAILAATSTPAVHSSAAAASVERPDVITSVDPPPVGDTVVGVYAAVGCGLFGRALGMGIVHPGVIAGAIASCGFMIFDALVLEP
jgi:hypothetical protein